MKGFQLGWISVAKTKTIFSVYVVVYGILFVISNLKGFFQDNDELNQFGEILEPLFFFFFFLFSENAVIAKLP